jgi:hypothetical protein
VLDWYGLVRTSWNHGTGSVRCQEGQDDAA